MKSWPRILTGASTAASTAKHDLLRTARPGVQAASGDHLRRRAHRGEQRRPAARDGHAGGLSRTCWWTSARVRRSWAGSPTRHGSSFSALRTAFCSVRTWCRRSRCIVSTTASWRRTDEYFEYPTHASGQGRWNICGLDLPEDVLRKVYRENALRLLPASLSVLQLKPSKDATPPRTLGVGFHDRRSCEPSQLQPCCCCAIAGLGGLLYGVDVGIIGGALPYLEATARQSNRQLFSNGQLSTIVAAVLLGSVHLHVSLPELIADCSWAQANDDF
jgi:F0F1-type ATP synthase membrane subunit c/vacuolar-type H+-ATPase subunit K